VLSARQVLVTIGTPCAMSALGSADTYRALVADDRTAIGFAGLDAGLVVLDASRSRARQPVFVHAGGDEDGRPISIEEIDRDVG
jgi:3-oxoacyl-[acyl-carrier-protein] synthase II